MSDASDPRRLVEAALSTLQLRPDALPRETVGDRSLAEHDDLASGETLAAGSLASSAGAQSSMAPTERAPRTWDPFAGPRTVDATKLPRIATKRADDHGDHEDADLIVTETLGRGGMGIVQAARQRSLQREVALKRLHGEPLASHAAALLREAAFTGYLEHPSIVPVHALGKDEAGLPLLVMKKIEGTTLGEVLRDPEAAAWKKAGDRLSLVLGAMKDVCDALAYAHSRGVVHRDVKPENVMLGPFGEVYLLDWGVAIRVGQRMPEGSIAGSPAFMAPEMLRPESGSIDERTDVYLVGATLHDCLTGAPPHRGATIGDVMLSVACSEPHAYGDDVPEELGAILNKAMHVDPGRRFASAAELRAALVAFGEHRASAELTRAAEVRLEQLVRALDRQDGAEDAAVAALFHECRFGLEQSLRAWPENARARGALRRAIERMCAHELGRRNRAGAEALLRELSPEPPELVAALARLRDELEAEERDRARLARMEHELDMTVAEDARRTAAGIVAVAATLLAAVLVSGYALRLFTPTPRAMLAVSFPILLVVAVAVWSFRGRLFRNQKSRLIGLTVLSTVALVLANRTTGVLRGRPFPDVIATDALLVSLASVLASLTLRKIYLVPAGVFLVASGLSLVVPEALAFAPVVVAALLSLAAVIKAPEGLRGPVLGDATDTRERRSPPRPSVLPGPPP